jgi:hypothetical protein
MGDRRNKLYVLDKELCCALYMRLGAYEKVSARLETEGILHPVTGLPFSRGGVMTAIKKSELYHEYFMKREKDPTLSLDPTPDEMQNAWNIIQERMPLQKALLAEAEKIQAIRLQHESVYMDKPSVPAPK